MNPSTHLFLVLGVVFLATFTRSALGFDDTLIAMPLPAMIVGIRTATPLVVPVGSTIALTILVGAWRQMDLGAAWRLIVSTMVGIPIGLFFLKATPEGAVKAVLGVVLIGFRLYNFLISRKESDNGSITAKRHWGAD